MRIVHLIHDYSPAIGGSELIMKRLSEELVRRGHEVHVVCSNATSPEDFAYGARAPLPRETTEIEGVKVHRLAYRRWPAPVRKVRDALAVGWWRRRLPGYGRVKAAWAGPWLRGAARTIETIQPDLIVAGTLPFLHLWVAERVARRLGVPWIAMPCLHSEDPWLMDNPSAWALLDQADGLFTLTAYESSLLRALGVSTESVVLGGGVEVPDPESLVGPAAARRELGIPADEAVVLFLGRLEKAKGIPAVVRAAERVISRGAVTFAFVGGSTVYSDGEFEDLLAEVRVRLPADRRDRLVVKRDVVEQEKWQWLEAADVLVQPSRVDSFGLVLLEAWAVGTPVVAARTGPQASLVRDGVDGRLIDPGQAEDHETACGPDRQDGEGELAAVLTELIESPEVARAMGEAGRQHVDSKWRWERTVDRAERFYLRQCDRRQGDGASADQVDSPPRESAGDRADRGVLAVVVTRNHRDSIAQTLDSLASGTRVPERIVVVDQGSTDGTTDLVRRLYPEVAVLGFLDNPGFAVGNHRGVRSVTDRTLDILLLNPDATLAPEALERLQAVLSENPHCGAVVPKTRMGWQPEILNSAGLCMNQVGYGWDRGYLELDRGQWDTPGPVIGGSGCALLVRRQAWDQIGGFDERYFLYYEDLDLSLRLRRAGWEVTYEPGAEAFHFTFASGRPESFSEGLDHRNRLMTLLKAMPSVWLLQAAPTLLRFEGTAVLGALRARRWSALRHRLGAWAWNLVRLLATLSRRRGALRAPPGAPIEATRLLSEGKAAPVIPVPVPQYREGYAATIDPAHIHSSLEIATGGDGGRLEDGALGLGWHGPEREQQDEETIEFRWSSGYGTFFLARPRAARTLVIRWRAARDGGVIVWANGLKAATVEVSAGQFVEQEVEIAPAVLPVLDAGGPVEFLLEVPGILIPSAMSDSTDRRHLGVAFSSVRWTD